MGSGKRLHYAYKKYGIENFTKEILKFFDTSKEAFEYEAEVVNEDLIKDNNCYNIKQGGEGWQTIGLVSVKDINGNCFDISKDDPRYLSGEFTGVTKGFVTVKDINGNYFNVSINDERLKNNELVGTTKGYVIVKDKNNNTSMVSVNDPRYLSGELIHYRKGLITVKDKNNNFYSVSLNDSRYLSGELIPLYKGNKHTKESINKLKETFKKNHHQQGEKNSQYGTCWITKNKENKKIKKEELEYYISLGWNKGRFIK